MELLYEKNNTKLYVFNPTVRRLFMNNMEPLHLPRRFRFILELHYGYKVYYLEKDKEIIGYCTVSNGKNPRYQFADENDIIFGPYFIKEEKRGNGYSEELLRIVLFEIGLEYKNAYDYIDKKNIPSIKVTEKIGGKKIGSVRINEVTRRMTNDKDGRYGIYRVIGRGN